MSEVFMPGVSSWLQVPVAAMHTCVFCCRLRAMRTIECAANVSHAQKHTWCAGSDLSLLQWAALQV